MSGACWASSVVPTAMQAVSAGQETATSRLFPAAGFGVASTAQPLPFQRSATVSSRDEASSKCHPTAAQTVPDVQVTPSRELAGPPTGFGVGWVVQLVPFQRSARGNEPGVALSWALP